MDGWMDGSKDIFVVGLSLYLSSCLIGICQNTIRPERNPDGYGFAVIFYFIIFSAAGLPAHIIFMFISFFGAVGLLISVGAFGFLSLLLYPW
ncbi:hypothetical protein F5Y10DRAFT_190949 [Nemania abortiva]|nr:hypothetical protein F5Y10DRAFT_190949 [Nemania abortiva]